MGGQGQNVQAKASDGSGRDITGRASQGGQHTLTSLTPSLVCIGTLSCMHWNNICIIPDWLNSNQTHLLLWLFPRSGMGGRRGMEGGIKEGEREGEGARHQQGG